MFEKELSYAQQKGVYTIHIRIEPASKSVINLLDYENCLLDCDFIEELSFSIA